MKSIEFLTAEGSTTGCVPPPAAATVLLVRCMIHSRRSCSVALVEFHTDAAASAAKRQFPSQLQAVDGRLTPCTFSFEEFKYLTTSIAHDTLSDKRPPLYVS